MVRAQLPIIVDDYSIPEPDIAVVPGGPLDYLESHPDTAALLAEISDTTLRTDQGSKLKIHARSGLPEYWIVNLNERQLEVYREPSAGGVFGNTDS